MAFCSPYAVFARLDTRFADRRFAREVAVALCFLLSVAAGAAYADREPAAQAVPAAVVSTAPPVVVVPPLTAPQPPAAPPAAARPAAPAAPVPRGPSVPPAVAQPAPAPPTALALPPAQPQPQPQPSAPVAEPPAVERRSAVVKAKPAARWLPSGTGMWLHEWNRSEGGDAAAVVDRALATGLTHLYVQTGSTKKGWIGEEVLAELLPATKGTGLSVIAWDFPKLLDPEGDARRLVQAATWQRPGSPRVAAVAPDVETSAEGTRLSADAVTRYYATLRAELPPHVAVLATVPWPSEKRVGSYPYAETAAHSDAFVPMAYWYNRSPTVVTATSMEWLRQFGKPVMPVGQGYDGRLDAPYLKADPAPDRSVQRFVDAARQGGARSISLWSWQTTDAPQWDVLSRARTQPTG